MPTKPVIDEIGRRQFSLLLEKRLGQREEHCSAKIDKHKMCHIYTFDILHTTLIREVHIIVGKARDNS
jgi:hypothetical protein